MGALTKQRSGKVSVFSNMGSEVEEEEDKIIEDFLEILELNVRNIEPE